MKSEQERLQEAITKLAKNRSFWLVYDLYYSKELEKVNSIDFKLEGENPDLSVELRSRRISVNFLKNFFNVITSKRDVSTEKEIESWE